MKMSVPVLRAANRYKCDTYRIFVAYVDARTTRPQPSFRAISPLQWDEGVRRDVWLPNECGGQ